MLTSTSYYNLNPAGPDDKIRAFPKGFSMIAGDNYRHNYTLGNVRAADPEQSLWGLLNQTTQADLAQRAIGFNCLDYKKDPEGSLRRHYLPDKSYLDANCTDGVRFEIAFPQCWDGNVTDGNYKTHLAYPATVLDGLCPPDFPIRLPGLFYEIIWNTPRFATRPGRFVIANGDLDGKLISSPLVSVHPWRWCRRRR